MRSSLTVASMRRTFDRIIDGGKSVFVRFDKEYSYGDEHDAWKDFAAKLGDSAADMLVGDVGVSEYGDKDNSDVCNSCPRSSLAHQRRRRNNASAPTLGVSPK